MGRPAQLLLTPEELGYLLGVAVAGGLLPKCHDPEDMVARSIYFKIKLAAEEIGIPWLLRDAFDTKEEPS